MGAGWWLGRGQTQTLEETIHKSFNDLGFSYRLTARDGPTVSEKGLINYCRATAAVAVVVDMLTRI